MEFQCLGLMMVYSKGLKKQGFLGVFYCSSPKKDDEPCFQDVKDNVFPIISRFPTVLSIFGVLYLSIYIYIHSIYNSAQIICMLCLVSMPFLTMPKSN